MKGNFQATINNILLLFKLKHHTQFISSTNLAVLFQNIIYVSLDLKNLWKEQSLSFYTYEY